MHGPILFHATAFFYFLFGDSDFTARIYTAALGVMVVLMPALFRPWLGRSGALLASILLLISPVSLYYHRYIRHDTPSIFFALLLFYAVLMYLNGPLHARRRLHWLLLVALAMIGNLGSKETAFIYIALLGSFLFLYWLTRLAQARWQLPGRTVFNFLIVAVLFGALAALGLVVLLTVVPLQTALGVAAMAGWWAAIEARTLLLGIVVLLAGMLAALLLPLRRVFRNLDLGSRRRDVLLVCALALIVCGGLLLVESVSHSAPQLTNEPVEPHIPGEEAADTVNVIRQLPLILAWSGAAFILLALFVSRRRGWWQALRRYPELDLIIVIGSLILPWATPFLIALTGAQRRTIRRKASHAPAGPAAAARDLYRSGPGMGLAPLVALRAAVLRGLRLLLHDDDDQRKRSGDRPDWQPGLLA